MALPHTRALSHVLARSHTLPNMPKHPNARLTNRKASQPSKHKLLRRRTEQRSICRASKTCAWPASCATPSETDSLALPLIPGSWTSTANGQTSHVLNRSTPCHLSPRSAPLALCPALRSLR
ncbi:hypothetical protein HDV57DRAFT_123280 [Trichoderma longibrachiatum]